jgi:hypothetical protein
MPDRRFQSAAELGMALRSVSAAAAAPVPAQWFSRQARAWIAASMVMATVMGTVAAVLAVMHFREKPPKLPAIQFSIFAPEGVTFGDVRYGGPPLISPDGSQLAFAGIDGRGTNQLWVRPLRSLTARPLPGTDDAMYPFWSPDSRWLAFVADGKLKKISIGGGPPKILARSNLRGGTWAQLDEGEPGTIVFPTEAGDGLQRISAAGGEPVRITMLDSSRNEVLHMQPQFLPDGRHLLFLAVGDGESSVVSIADVRSKPDSKSVQRLNIQGTSRVWWAPPGYLLFLRDHNLIAQVFDTLRFKVSGEPLVIAEHVGNGFNRHTKRLLGVRHGRACLESRVQCRQATRMV